MQNLQDLEREIWKDIKGFEGYYQCSNKGNVKGIYREVFNGTNKRPIKEKQLVKRKNRGGYLVVSLCINGKTTLPTVHRLIAKTFIPNPENKSSVNHIDGNKLNNNDWNLEWSTPKENTQHALRTGLIKTGEKRYNAKTTNDTAKQIRADYLYGKRGGFIEGSRLTRQMLAEKYGVSFHVIKEILSNKTYHDPNFVKPD